MHRQSGLVGSTATMKLRRGVGLAVGAVLAASAAAQEAAPAAPAAALEELTVTGSRIARADATAVGALTTLTFEDIEFAGPASVGELLQELPGAGVSLNSNGTQGTSFGVSSINLRYLGSAEGSGNRVLVLVDGHRWVNAAGGRGFRDFVDLNTIPMGIVESIEVLKDGASAIYGADAIAGVVNIRTRKSIDGFEGKLNYGETSRGDGESMSAVLNFGHNFGRLSALVSLNYVNTDPILTEDRALTEFASVPVTAPPNSPRGLYVLPGVNVAASPLTRIPGASGNAPADFRAASLPADFYNTQQQGIYATGPSERMGIFGRLTFDFTDNLSGYVEALYNERESDQLFSPLLLDVRQNQGYTIPANHPFNPWGIAFTGTALRLQRVPVEVGNRDNVQNVETQRFAAGLEGSFELGRTWKWDLFASHAKNDATFKAFNQINYDNLALGLGDNARCAANGCVPVNIFGELTPAMADYIRFNGLDENGTKQVDLAYNMSTRLFDLPAGSVGVATGLEWREESAYDRPDAYANSAPQFVTAARGRTSAAQRDATSGKYDLWEAYLEVDIPLLADMTMFQALDLSAAVRYSDYSTFGDATTTKLGLAWRPVEDLLLRGTFSEGFRAPSILELFQGSRQTTFQAVDPCNGGGAGLPGCAGVPATYNQSQFGAGTIRGVVGGNPNLEAETADTWSAGFAWTPSFVGGMSFTTDWWRITIDDAIASQTAQNILRLCAVRAGIFCSNVQRDLSTGEVLELRQSVVNFSRIQVEGVDFTWRYVWDTGIGRFSAVADASKLLHFTTFAPQPDGSVLVDERAGKGDSPRATYPHWKGQGALRWNNGPWDAGYRARYIGSTSDVPDNAVNGGKTSDIWYQDLQVGYQFERFNTYVALGVDNVFDKMPPASRANNPINFDIYTYDVRGRYYFLRLNAKM
jgi:iron complex outermembrane recepter protein